MMTNLMKKEIINKILEVAEEVVYNPFETVEKAIERKKVIEDLNLTYLECCYGLYLLSKDMLQKAVDKTFLLPSMFTAFR